jgi:uncharacterized protein (TIGR00369 family)
MTSDILLQTLRDVNDRAIFNRWAQFVVVRAEPGEVELTMTWREEFGQYVGFLHAGLIGALIDTACGFAAFTKVGPVLASHFSVNCLAPGLGETFIARGRVVKAGRKQVFAAAELFAVGLAGTNLVATGNAILVAAPVPEGDTRDI